MPRTSSYLGSSFSFGKGDDFFHGDGNAQDAEDEFGVAARAFIAAVFMAEAADPVGVLAAVRLLFGDGYFLAVEIQAAQQAGDPRAECGIVGKVRVGLRLGIPGTTAR